MRRTGLALLVTALLGACGEAGESDEGGTKPTGTEPEATEPETASYPRGYPKTVRVSSLPDKVRSWYERDNYKRAVAVAPGVWTPIPPGATVEDALASDTRDGFCGSIKAYERKYTPGVHHAGVCW